MQTAENIFGQPPEQRPSRAARLLRELQLRRGMSQVPREADVLDRLLSISGKPFPEVPYREQGTRHIATYYTVAGRLVLTALGPYLRVVIADLSTGSLTEWRTAAEAGGEGTLLQDEAGGQLRLHLSPEGEPLLEGTDGDELLRPFSELLREAGRVTVVVAQSEAGGRSA